MAHKVQVKEESILMTRDNGDILSCHFRKVFSLSCPIVETTNTCLLSFYVADINFVLQTPVLLGPLVTLLSTSRVDLFSSMTCLMVLSVVQARHI